MIKGKKMEPKHQSLDNVFVMIVYKRYRNAKGESYDEALSEH
jgi:hypothetical protein